MKNLSPKGNIFFEKVINVCDLEWKCHFPAWQYHHNHNATLACVVQSCSDNRKPNSPDFNWPAASYSVRESVTQTENGVRKRRGWVGLVKRREKEYEWMIRGGMKNKAKNKIKDRPVQSLSSSPLFPHGRIRCLWSMLFFWTHWWATQDIEMVNKRPKRKWKMEWR